MLNVLDNERGMTYLAVMIMVSIMSISLMAIGKQWKIVMKRDQEAELLFRGNRIRAAIEKFAADYEVKKGQRDHRLPVNLEELTRSKHPYLQKVYKDPITRQDFELIRAVGVTEQQEGIIGVRSRSRDKPLDQIRFPKGKTYHDLAFVVSAKACSENGSAGRLGSGERGSSRLEQQTSGRSITGTEKSSGENQDDAANCRPGHSSGEKEHGEGDDVATGAESPQD